MRRKPLRLLSDSLVLLQSCDGQPGDRCVVHLNRFQYQQCNKLLVASRRRCRCVAVPRASIPRVRISTVDARGLKRIIQRMANSLIPSIGFDMENPGTYYWDIRTSGARDVLILVRGFPSLDKANADFERFRNDLARAAVIVNDVERL